MPMSITDRKRPAGFIPSIKTQQRSRLVSLAKVSLLNRNFQVSAPVEPI
ncbi:hypothetical protein SAMN02745225_02388, partial [Ferrithrix thermotolerans DSM 19514]